jgi:hypothetical protein
MMEMKPYKWTGKDKRLYAFSMIPFVIAFVGAAYILATYSIGLTFVSIGLYVLVNVFQAGCCVGCPYRGTYCPAFCGVHLGNYLSGILYRDRNHDELFFKRNATAGEITLILWILFPLYWIFQTSWYLIPVYILLLALHAALFMPTQCAKCSYNLICPGGQAWQSCRKMFGSSGNHED